MRIRNLDELDPVNDGRVLLGTETGIIGKTDGKLSDIIGDAAEAAVSGKVDQDEYDAAMDGINDELDAIDDAISNISANYATTEYVDKEIGKIGSYTVAEGTDEGPTLEPSVASEKVIYLVKDEGITGTDQYREWIVAVNEQEEKIWTCIGDTSFEFNLSAGTDLKYENGEMSVNTNGTIANSADMSFVAGSGTYASGEGSFAIGVNTSAVNVRSFAGGHESIASGEGSFALGDGTIADGPYSHAEGSNTYANGNNCHAEGHSTSAIGQYNHAEGANTLAAAQNSHAEGWGSKANGDYSHAEGYNTSASGYCSHAEGMNTIAASNGMHAGGTFNKTSADVLFVIGNGSYNGGRSDAFVIDQTGLASATKLATSGIQDVEAKITNLESTIGNIETILQSI